MAQPLTLMPQRNPGGYDFRGFFMGLNRSQDLTRLLYPFDYFCFDFELKEVVISNRKIDILSQVDYNRGTQTMEVGADMAKERDYAKEWETAKARGELKVGVKVTHKLNEDFAARCAANNTTKNAVLKRYIERYTYENFDQ